MKQTHFIHEIVDFVPEKLEEGKIYVSFKYGTAVHKCACGCGEEVVTPLNPTDWSIEIHGDKPTLHPSIGNWSFACQSHYLIRQGKVVWAAHMTRQQIERGRARDQAKKQQYFAEVNRQKEPPPGLLARFWKSIVHWWNS
jgi:hypothetical protein